MIELDYINLRQYFELEDKTEYDFAIKYGLQFESIVSNLYHLVLS